MTALPLILTVFVACAVEAIEALTIVLAAGLTREWRSTFQGMAAALLVLAAIVAALGPTITLLPLTALRLVVGALLAIFGLQWLRKAILRATGYKSLHDEAGAYLRRSRRPRPRPLRPAAACRLVRLHAGVQGRPARRPGGRLHRDHVRRQPAQCRRRGDRRGRGRDRGRGDRCAGAGTAGEGAGERDEVRGGHHAHLRSASSGAPRAPASPGPARTRPCSSLVPVVALVALCYTVLLRRAGGPARGRARVRGGDQLVRRLRSIGAFWYDFVVGDDWRVAVVVVAALARPRCWCTRPA